MRALVTAVVGAAGAGACARAARRYAVADRLRTRARKRWFLPARIRRVVGAALGAAALDVDPEHACTLWAAGAAGATMLGAGVGGASVALGLGALVAIGVPACVMSLRHRRARLIAAAVPAMLERVASELRAGGTIATAIAALAAGDDPLAGDLARVGARVGVGATAAEALRMWSVERTAVGVDAAAGALALCTSVGGRAADALDGLATSLRERAAVAAEARALSAQARMSALVVGGAPVVFLAWSALVDPRSVHALTASGAGRACLGAGVALDALGGWWMRRIVAAGSVL